MYLFIILLFASSRSHEDGSSKRKDAFAFYKKIACGMCDGLAYLHEKGFIHRNLTLSSVMVNVYLVGFAKYD